MPTPCAMPSGARIGITSPGITAPGLGSGSLWRRYGLPMAASPKEAGANKGRGQGKQARINPAGASRDHLAEPSRGQPGSPRRTPLARVAPSIARERAGYEGTVPINRAMGGQGEGPPPPIMVALEPRGGRGQEATPWGECRRVPRAYGRSEMYAKFDPHPWGDHPLRDGVLHYQGSVTI